MQGKKKRKPNKIAKAKLLASNYSKKIRRLKNISSSTSTKKTTTPPATPLVMTLMTLPTVDRKNPSYHHSRSEIWLHHLEEKIAMSQKVYKSIKASIKASKRRNHKNKKILVDSNLSNFSNQTNLAKQIPSINISLKLFRTLNVSIILIKCHYIRTRHPKVSPWAPLET